MEFGVGKFSSQQTGWISEKRRQVDSDHHTHENLISINDRHYHSTTVTEYKKKINTFQISQTATFPSQVHKKVQIFII